MAEFVLLPRSRRGWAEAASPSPLVHECPARRPASDRIRRLARDGVLAERSLPASGANGGAVAQRALRTTPCASDRDGKSAGELFFTGTGSAMPCKHRNVSGMCLTASNGSKMLLDVGEGTIGQLLRRALAEQEEEETATVYCGERALSGHGASSQNAAASRRLLGSIRAVWISHPHADHHLGLLRLLQERATTPGNPEELPLLLVAPACVFQFLERCRELGLLGSDRFWVPVDCRDLLGAGGGSGGPARFVARRHLEEAFGWKDVWSVPVEHCADAYAVVLDGTPFGRFVYSGDCRPSPRLARLARPADLLVHEATFEDGKEDEARFKMHSTVGEALGVARAMEASCVVLTHFSQRYPRIPPLSPANPVWAPEPQLTGPSSSEPQEVTKAPTIVFAFDYMRLAPYSLAVASQLTDALRMLQPSGSGAGSAESAGGTPQDLGVGDSDDDE
jgi:ribonuclease Z